MSALPLFERNFAACPLVAIIRGVTPGEVEAIGEAIVGAGINIIEVPLNSPEALASIAKLAARFGDEVLVGAGTVLTVAEVGAVRDAGARLVVSPNTDAEVIAASVAAGMVSCPGYFTPSEGFAALGAGAHALKLFPAEAASPALVKAHRAVLPKSLPLIVVGGVKPDAMGPWLEAGANGFGLGSGLFRPGQSADEVAANALGYVAGVRR